MVIYGFFGYNRIFFGGGYGLGKKKLGEVQSIATQIIQALNNEKTDIREVIVLANNLLEKLRKMDHYGVTTLNYSTNLLISCLQKKDFNGANRAAQNIIEACIKMKDRHTLA